ncbi:MAG: hypothetical protein ACE5KV_04845 [Thermoplasmata archaeon]
MSDVEVTNSLRKRALRKFELGLAVLFLILAGPVFMLVSDRGFEPRVLLVLVLATAFVLIPFSIAIYLVFRHSPRRMIFGADYLEFDFGRKAMTFDWEGICSVSGHEPLEIQTRNGQRCRLRLVDPRIVKAVLTETLRRGRQSR